MATVNKDFKIKHGLIVEGTTGTINTYDILTKSTADQNYIIGLIGGSATSQATPNTVVLRDANGSFSANIITADILGDVTGDVTGTVSSLSNHTTTNLAEGTNLYYTDARVRAAVSVEANGPLTYNGTTGEFDLAVGNGLTVTAGSLVIDETVTATRTWVTGQIDTLTTDAIEEGTTNQYFTVARAREAISVDGGLVYNNETGVISANLGNGLEFALNGKIQIDDTIVVTETDLSGAISAHNVATGVHGIDGDVVGTTDTQTLENKTLGAGTTLGATLDANNNVISGLAAPVADGDAANKLYVDTVAAEGLHVQEGVDVATTGTLATISGGTVTYDNGTAGVGATLTTTGTFTVIDGVTLTPNPTMDPDAGGRVLVKNEANAAHNGIYYLTSATVLTRDPLFDSDAEIEGGDFVFVVDGNTFAGSGWVQTATVNVIGTDLIVWSQFSGAGTYTAGNGLTLVGTEFSINTSVTATNQYVTDSVSGHSNLTTAVHGVAGDVVGTSDTQTLTNKTLGTGSVLGADLDAANTYKVVNLAEPASNQDAATKFYVDNAIGTVNETIDNLTTTEIAEGTNKYFTVDRATDAAGDLLANATKTNIQISYDSGTNQLTVTAENGVADSTTDDLAEGTTNKYFTDTRARAAISDGDGITYNATTGVISADHGTGLTIDAGKLVIDSTITADKTWVANEIDAAIAAGDITATPTYLAINVNDVAKQVAATQDVATASTVTAFSWAAADYRSAKLLVKFADAAHTEVSEILVTLDALNNVAITEYAIVTTNGSLGDVTADVSGTDVRILTTTNNNNTTVTVVGTLLV